MAFVPKAYILTNKIQRYEWGERGETSFIAKLLDMHVSANIPLAEMWIGTHPLGTSELIYGGKSVLLSDLVQRYPLEILGQRVASAFLSQFPFLLKVLSASEPLSIQLHPSKAQAAMLHQNDPTHYPDSNHKPEIAIALERLHALAGLRDARQITTLMTEHPALSAFVEFEAISDQPEPKQPKLTFQSLMRNAMKKPDQLAQVIDQLAAAFQQKDSLSYREKLFLEMCAKYPGDVGLLAIFFLKLHSLNKGQAMFIPPGVPHAYLKGNIVECMASSDNVIRAGLTPKFNDIPTLIDVLTDQQAILYSPDAPSYAYPAPVTEFRLWKFEMATGKKLGESNNSVRVFLVMNGQIRLTWLDGGLDAGRGQTILAPATLGSLEIECLENCEIYKVDVP